MKRWAEELKPPAARQLTFSCTVVERVSVLPLTLAVTSKVRENLPGGVPEILLLTLQAPHKATASAVVTRSHASRRLRRTASRAIKTDAQRNSSQPAIGDGTLRGPEGSFRSLGGREDRAVVFTSTVTVAGLLPSSVRD